MANSRRMANAKERVATEPIAAPFELCNAKTARAFRLSATSLRPNGAPASGDVGLESDWSRTGVGPESDWGPTGVRLESDWSRTGVGLGSDWSRTGVGLESDWSRTGVGPGVDWCRT